jgi:hypothetical protein
MKKHYETHVEDTDKLISVAGPELDYKSWYEQYRKLMEEQAQRKYGLYTPTSEGDDDDFPSIPGMIARYSALGLTNEQMKENPVWVDKTGNGHDLQMKNFLWGGMSGVGGYGDENYRTFYKFTLDNYVFIASPPGVKHMNFTFRVTGLQPRNKLTLAFFGTTNTVYGTWGKDGIYTVDADIVEAGKPTYFYNGYGATRGEFTIEILPLYPGFILGDGVDDLAVTEKELNFEDTYTVYTAFIPFQNNPTRNMILCGADSKKTFSMQYSSLVYVSFIAGNNYYINANFVNGLNLFACKRNGNNICIKNLLTNKVVTGTCGDWVENAGLYYLWKNATYASFTRAAIAGQTICNGYFSTDEDDEKVLDWYKKQYPWLFPDQAWTVTGKTNEDKDRATIANITGNGNDLVLSNFGFAEGSGYGLYKTPFELYPSVQHSSKYSLSFSKFALGDHNLIIAPKQNDLSYDIKVKVTGLKDGVKFKWGWIGTTGYIDITTDGIHMLNKPASQIRQLIVEFAEDFDPDHVVTIEQIPEYEGYLVTDGVDDKIISSIFKMGNDWTVIGDWELINTGKNDNAGIVKFDSIVIYNYNSMLINIKNGRNILIPDQNTVNAICSDGRIYSKDWKESIYNEETESTSKNFLTIGYSGNAYTKIAFKNLAIYPTVLSREDCIKAYNYLQTLKAK